MGCRSGAKEWTVGCANFWLRKTSLHRILGPLSRPDDLMNLVTCLADRLTTKFVQNMLDGLAKSRNLITGKSQSALETIRFIRSVRRSEKARSCFLDGGGEEESERAVRAAFFRSPRESDSGR